MDFDNLKTAVSGIKQKQRFNEIVLRTEYIQVLGENRLVYTFLIISSTSAGG